MTAPPVRSGRSTPGPARILLLLGLSSAIAGCAATVHYAEPDQAEILSENVDRFFSDAVWREFLTGIDVREGTAQVTTSNALVASMMCGDIAAVAFDDERNRIGVEAITVRYEPTGGELVACEVPSSYRDVRQ